MNDDNRLKTAAMLSELWDGKPIKRVRALDGVTILPGRRLTLHIMIQPDAAAGFLCNGTLRDKDFCPAYCRRTCQHGRNAALQSNASK